jgi:hypothetical protein
MKTNIQHIVNATFAKLPVMGKFRKVHFNYSYLSSESYSRLNIIFLFISFFIIIFPLVTIYLGFNIKSCETNTNCASCGITRDFYSILTFDTINNLKNSNSIYIFIVFSFQVLFRLFIFKFKQFNLTQTIDFFLSTVSLILLFILFNHF